MHKNILYQIAIMTFIHISNRLAVIATLVAKIAQIRQNFAFFATLKCQINTQSTLRYQIVWPKGPQNYSLSNYYYDFYSYVQPFGSNRHTNRKNIQKTAKIDQKSSKISNLKVDALPYSSTDSTHIYRLYYSGIPLSTPGIKNCFASGCQKK